MNGEINNVPEINYYNKLRSFQESEDIPVDLYLENFNNCKEKYAIKRYILKLVSNYEKYKECLDDILCSIKEELGHKKDSQISKQELCMNEDKGELQAVVSNRDVVEIARAENTFTSPRSAHF
ncbi:hypothetical protein POWCR01_130007800 [Plasmodium ovale]|uniref:PIR protein n=1 Tax=Plasmodium ovale TaxID=36330 RepID=A0A1C3KWK5_PLAOA|nr:hypothetical protein POWCR01_130007800 [Plasmodium ovale]